MNKLVLLLVLFLLGTAAQTEARPRPRYVRAVMKGKPGHHRPNYTPYRGSGSPFRGMLAWMR
jgi:hypothetical protein